MVKKTAEKGGGGMAARASSSEFSENNPRQNFRLGDITWVRHGASSWWPAQVIDEASVSSKPKKKTVHDALVRLYGTCQYLYVDPWKSNTEFKMILKEENKTAMEAFHKVLQKELTHFKSPSDHDEEPVSTKECGRSIKRAGNGVGADSSNGAKRPRKGRAANLETKDCQNSSPSRDSAMEGSEQRSARQIKIMQKLGLVAPSGSPFKGLVAAAHP